MNPHDGIKRESTIGKLNGIAAHLTIDADADYSYSGKNFARRSENHIIRTNLREWDTIIRNL
ncbi:hypothetical protein V22_41850 [Calycomorphotria hydatis]|uniref:Uncharacterized protein n=1 Tax=Calycomorphotria hydatis TaxID=2528027 RepID=A0A517TEW1_9PLAN|nr:hypothetical protein V22_41850 [Calycomorphotria hydatis]